MCNGGLDVSEAKRLKAPEDENSRLKRLLADAMLDNAGLKELLTKNGNARRAARGGRSPPVPIVAAISCARAHSADSHMKKRRLLRLRGAVELQLEGFEMATLKSASTAY